MDTASHLLMGATLAGLSCVHPEVAQHPELAAAILTGTLIGSHAPDFDVVARLRGYTNYLKNHRGITHSLPALVIWPTVLSLPIAWMYDVMNHFFLLFTWILVAVIIHVGLDLLNSYGVQCLRPVKQKWYHLDIICLFDPILFAMHSTGLILWSVFGVEPGQLFIIVYGMSILYILLKTLQHTHNMRLIKNHYGQEGIYHVIPTIHPFKFQYVLEAADHFYVGHIINGFVKEAEQYIRQQENEIIELTKKIDGVRAFLHFAQRVHVHCTKMQDGYHITWSDARFYHNRKLNFGVDVFLNNDKELISMKSGYRSRNWVSPI